MFEAALTPEQLQDLRDLALERNTDVNRLLREAADDLLVKYQTRKKLAQGKTVMLVDDSTFMRATLREMLQKHGFKVLGEAENGKLGAQYYSNFLVDYVLLGIQMPIMDGMGFLKAIDKRENCKVIVVTAACYVRTVLEAIEYGADYFVIKPFNSEQLIDVLSMHDSEYFNADYLQKYSNYFFKTMNYTEDTNLTQADIDALKDYE